MVEIYQIKAWIRKISPIICRRILLPVTFSLADLHHTLQIIFGWPDTYLHQFKIHGKRYGISKPGGVWFSDNPKEALLKSFGFPLKERFHFYPLFISRRRHRYKSCYRWREHVSADEKIRERIFLREHLAQ